MKVLVTGATGFVGSHLCDLLTKNNHQVFALVRNPTKAKEFGVPGVHLQGDLSSFEWINDLPKDLDAVVHTAGIVHSFDSKDFYDVNATATKALIEALASFDGLKFTLVSSQAAGGPSPKSNPAKEDANAAVSDYGRSKLLAEEYVACAPKSWSVSVVRPPMVIGPRDPAVLDIFKMVKGRVIVSPGSRPTKKQYSYVCVFDLVNFLQFLIEKNISGTFYCAYPAAITLQDLVDNIKTRLNKKTVNIVIPPLLLKGAAKLVQKLGEKNLTQARLTSDKMHELLPSAWVCDSKASINAGFSYQWDLDKTIDTTINDYKQRGWL
tara:strand:+ start:25121 stop:26086 length:966 start_codon:yes stop_codon:yes gene_type:complete